MDFCDRLFSVEELLAGEGRHFSGRLTTAEKDRFQSFRNPQASRLWLAGRFALKTLLVETFAISGEWNELHIESRNGLDRMTRPRVYLRGILQPWSLSLAHIEGRVFAAVAEEDAVRLGVDAVAIGAISARAADFWFAPEEIDWCRGGAAPFLRSVVWLLKEARYKAENEGEPFRPRLMDGRPRFSDAEKFRDWTASDQFRCNWIWEQEGRKYAVRASERIAAAVCAVRRDCSRSPRKIEHCARIR